MHFYITGDTHGNFNRIEEFCSENDTTKEDVMIILGDAGINYWLDNTDRQLKNDLSSLDITLFCVHTYYVLSVWSDTKKYEEQGSYLDFVTARQQGKEENTKFLIEKRAFECIEAGSGKVLGGMEFDEQGYRKNRFWLYSTVVGEFAGDIDNTSFEDKHVKLPLMFRRGDIVHIIGTELYGIVDAPENDEEEEQYITVAEKGDYSDFQVPVNLMYEGQKFLSVFSHEHCAPTDIEYARLDEQDNRKGFLEYMKKTLYEKSFVTGPGRDKERFDEILSKLEKVWNQYPDLRLGQLLVIVCGKSDLFMIEDEELLERLQYNQFPIE